MDLTAVLTPAEEGGFVALNPETGTTTQGDSIEDAIANLKEATSLYLCEFPIVTRGHSVVTIPMQPALEVGLLTRLLKHAEVGTDESLSAH